jgi:hypothetical protein
MAEQEAEDAKMLALIRPQVNALFAQFKFAEAQQAAGSSPVRGEKANVSRMLSSKRRSGSRVSRAC